MRVTIRKPLHDFISKKATALGIQDEAEVVNYILMQVMDRQLGCVNPLEPSPSVNYSSSDSMTSGENEDYSDLSGLLG
jgi:hypothetical protein